MSDIINDLLNKVSALTQTVNQIIAGSKSIAELPEQTTLDGTSLLHASRGGTSEKISVQQIINAAVNNDNDHLLSVGAITLVANDLTIASISGKINNVVQSIATPTVVNVPYCATGLNRIDLIVYNDSNAIVRIAGTETGGAIIVTPTQPLETLLITQISVSDFAIGDPSSPILGASYVKKSFANMFEFNGIGADAIIPLNPNGFSEIRLINSGLTSVSGVDLTLMTGPNFEFPYQGKPFVFLNRTGGPIDLNHEDFATADLPLFLRDGANTVFPENHAILFHYDSAGLYEINRSWNAIDITTLSNATLPLVGTEEALVHDGVDWKKVAVSEFGGSGTTDTIAQSSWEDNKFNASNQVIGSLNGYGANGGNINNGLASPSINDFMNFLCYNSGTSANGGYRYLQISPVGGTGIKPQAGSTSFGVFCIYENSSADTLIRMGFGDQSNMPTDHNFGAYLEITGSTAVFKTASFGARSTTASGTLTYSTAQGSEIPYLFMIHFATASLVEVKLVKHDGTVVLNTSLNTNIPPSNARYYASVMGCIQTAGSDRKILGISRFGFGVQKPKFLNSF